MSKGKWVSGIFNGLEYETIEGVNIATVPVRAFDGEHERRSYAYVSAVWLAGIWFLATNISVAVVRKLKNPRTPLRKILWDMGRNPKHYSCFFGDGFSRYNHQAKVCAAGWKSLDLFYNYHEKIHPQLDDDLESRLTRFWIGKLENRQAVTNRLKICVNLLSIAFQKFEDEPEIRLLSIASGSAQAVIRAMQKYPGLNIKAVLIDADVTAVQESRRLVHEAGYDNRFTFIRGTSSRLENACAKFKPHIVEMVGFLDYRPDDKAKQLISRIRQIMPADGLFLTCNIRGNREKLFLDWLLLWPMIYRSKREFAEILKGGGFHPDKIQILYEPFEIHGIGVCRK